MTLLVFFFFFHRNVSNYVYNINTEQQNDRCQVSVIWKLLSEWKKALSYIVLLVPKSFFLLQLNENRAWYVLEEIMQVMSSAWFIGFPLKLIFFKRKKKSFYRSICVSFLFLYSLFFVPFYNFLDISSLKGVHTVFID